MTRSAQTPFTCCWPARRPSRDTDPASSEAPGPPDLFLPAARVRLARPSLREMVLSRPSRPGTHAPTRHCESPCIFPPVRIPWGGPSPGERKKPLLVGEGPEEAAACVFGVHIDGKTAFASWALWSLRGSGLVAGSPSQRGPREPRASPRGKSRREWRSEGPAGSSRVCAPSLLRETRCRDTLRSSSVSPLGRVAGRGLGWEAAARVSVPRGDGTRRADSDAQRWTLPPETSLRGKF